MANEGEADRVLRVLLRFGLDEQSAQTTLKALDSEETAVADIAKQWDLLRNQAGLSEKDTVTAIQGSVTGMKLQEDQILAIVKAYEDKQAAEAAASAKVQADLEAESDRLKQIQENTDLIAQSFTNVLGLGRMEVSLGRGITSLGKLIGNEDITRIGQATTALGRFTSAVGRLPQAAQAIRNMGDTLSKFLGGGTIAGIVGIAGTVAAAAAAALAAAKLMDETNKNWIVLRGKSFLTEEGTPLGQTYQASMLGKQALGFPDIGKLLGLQTLSYDAGKAGDVVIDSATKIEWWSKQVADATKAVFDPAADAAGMAYDTAKKLREVGVSDFSIEGLQKALDKNKELLDLRLTEGDVVGSTAAQVSDAIGVIKAALAEAKAAQPLTKATPAFIEYQKSITDSEKKYGDDRQKIVDDNLKQIANITERYARQNESAWTNFVKAQAHADQSYADQRLKILNSGVEQEHKAEQSYYAQRAKAAESYNLEVQRMEQEHQVQMQRMEQDHGKKLRKLADDRDALGIEDEMESYRTERGRAEEDYQRKAAQQSEDFARQIADMEASFKEQEQVRKDDRQKQLDELAKQKAEDDAQRKADYEAAAAEREKNKKEDLAQAAKDGKDKLDQAAQQHRDELQQIDDAWQTRRQQLGLWLAGEQAQMDNYMAARQADLQNWVNTHLSVPGATGPTTVERPTIGHNVPEFQAGGYTAGGLAQLHAGEFVANPQTTRLLEQLVGGQLTQQNLIGAMAGNQGGPISINVTQTFSGQESNPATYKALMYQTITEVFDKAMRS